MNLFLPTRALTEFIKRVSEKAKVFYPFSEDGKSHFVQYRADNQCTPDFNNIRTSENIKHFFFPSRDTVARFPTSLVTRSELRVIMGVKNCDLRGIEVYDRVFLNWEPEDNIYKERRENTIVFSADCPEPQASCFCNFVGLKPYATGISDGNISVVEGGYVFEVFTDQGSSLIEANKDLFSGVKDQLIIERDEKRKKAEEKLRAINQKQLKREISELVEKADRNIMRKTRDECVECFSCLHGCPTCYCFLLSDYKKGENVERIRTWDACYYAAYARVGGGANPRSRFDERFWNRFQCKFNYFHQYEKIYACSGCGRCFVGCSARIDIREILSGL